MLVFPQLATGGSALYPVRKTRVERTALNTLGDGRTDLYFDSKAGITIWDFVGKGFTRAEWDAVENLFEQTSGRQKTFVLLDPVGNLLGQSETLSDPLWVKDAQIQLVPGIGDPFGTTKATRVTNTGQTAQQVGQILNVPGNFHYCFSGWFRSASGSNAVIAVAAGSHEVSQTILLTSQWQRAFVSGNPAQAAAPSVTFQTRLGAGATIDVFGLQAEAQLAPSDYKQTGARAGVYANARFATDAIAGRAHSLDVHDSVIRIVSTGN